MKKQKKNTWIRMRISKEDKLLMEQRAIKFGFTNLSEFIRIITIKGNLEIK